MSFNNIYLAQFAEALYVPNVDSDIFDTIEDNPASQTMAGPNICHILFKLNSYMKAIMWD